MKIFWVTLIIISIFFASSFYYAYSVGESTHKIIDVIEDMEENIREKDWEETNNRMEILESTWEDLSRSWKIFVEHQELHDIEKSILKLNEYIKGKSEVLTKTELATLKYLVRQIHLDNKIEISNIF